MDSTTAQIFCARLNVNIVARAAIFNIALVRFSFLPPLPLLPLILFPIYYKSRMRIFEIADKNRGANCAPPAVYTCARIARTILILYLRIQYHFSAASRQTGANRRKNVFVVDALIWESRGVFIAVISILKAIIREYLSVPDIFISLEQCERNAFEIRCAIYVFETRRVYVYVCEMLNL